MPNFFRTPYGPGWALVGDAGYSRDPVTARGISDAFADAELCADAVHEFLAGTRPYDEAMAEYHQTRDARVRDQIVATAPRNSAHPLVMIIT